MVVLRLVTVLVLSLALDLSAPLVPESMEGLDEAQVVARFSHGRHSVSSFQDVSVSPVGSQTRTSVQLMQRTSWRPPVRPMTSGWVRKTPPSVSDSQSAPEDH
jgi:hypothetical protein